MAQILVGKLLPNLKVTLGNDAEESEYSEEKDYEFTEKERENSSSPNVEIVRSWMESLQSPKIYRNKSGGFTTGLDLISEDNTELLDKRAERFGLEKEESSLTPNISSLYESMGISTENRNSTKMKNIRLDALHLRGVNELNTNEIFHYFRDYGPASVEWINDFSCNVVWLDETSCARALLGVSKPLSSKANTVEETVHQDTDDVTEDQESLTSGLNHNKEEANMDVDDDSQVKSCSSESSVSLDIPVPPGHWRLGMSHPKAKTILLRFSNKDDKKLPGAEKRSNYYKKYGNPNYGGLKGLISSSRKRKIQAAVNKRTIEKESSVSRSIQSVSPDTHQSDVSAHKASNLKPPRMRMYADDEELKTRKLWSDDNFTEKHRSVHSRLGSKYTKDDLCHLGSYYRGLERDERPKDVDDYELDNLSFTSRSNKWDKKRNWPSENQVDLRAKLKRLRSDNVNKHSRRDDLNKHRSPLCIDIESRPKD